MSKNDSTNITLSSRNRQLTWANAGRLAVAIACLLNVQTSISPALAADWGYDSDYADDKENDPKFSDHKSNVRPPQTRDPIQQADDIDRGGVGELDAAAGSLSPSKGQKPAAKPVSKPSSKSGASKPNSKGVKTPTTDPNPVADRDTWGSSDDANSSSQINAPADQDQGYDSNNQSSKQTSNETVDEANVEPDPVYREGISLPPSKVPIDQQKKIINAWLNLFGLCAPIEDKGKLPKGPDFSAQFTDEQKARFSAELKKLLSGKEQAGYKAIDNYWSALSRLLQDVDHRSNYRVLFRSLLSLRADSPEISEGERGMLNEALGPKRIAEIGPPPLTEDAIEAYTDMTCFLYEQSHAGKTVDAEDNRALYGMIIRDKFKKAPSDRDRMAMNQFPLSWAKFRILYTDANPSEKVLLAERMASEQGTKGLGIRNAMLEQVLSTPVWMRFVVGSNKVMATSNAGSSAAKPRTSGGALKSGGFKTDALQKRMDSISKGMDAQALSLKGVPPVKKPEAKPAASTAKPKRQF